MLKKKSKKTIEDVSNFETALSVCSSRTHPHSQYILFSLTLSPFVFSFFLSLVRLLSCLLLYFARCFL